MACACNLIIDSCCDLPFEVVDREGVELINFPYIMEDGEHVDDLYQTTTAHDFFQAMRDGAQPTTSQVPIPVYQDAFKRAIDSGVPTVCLVFSSGLSGTYHSACLAAEELAKRTRSEVVQVIGSKFVLYRETHSKPKEKRIALVRDSKRKPN